MLNMMSKVALLESAPLSQQAVGSSRVPSSSLFDFAIDEPPVGVPVSSPDSAALELEKYLNHSSQADNPLEFFHLNEKEYPRLFVINDGNVPPPANN